MKQRRPKRRKSIRQPRKQLPPTSTDKPPASDWQMPLAEPTRTHGRNPGMSGITPLPLRAEANIKLEDTRLTADATVVWDSGIATKSVIERRLTEQPAVIRDTARALSREFKSQATEWRQQRPNDPDRIAQCDKLILLTENVANGLANLADNLDQAITKASEDKPEPLFLGKAAELVQQLQFGFMEWLKENRAAVFEVPLRVGIFVTGVIFLHSVGADSTAAIAALGVLVKSTATKKDKAQRQRK
jgi:hypothetical protein